MDSFLTRGRTHCHFCPPTIIMSGVEEALAPIYFVGERRWVLPHYFSFVAFAKQRWLGRLLIDVYTSEFKAFSREYYISAIQEGRITVHKKKVTEEYIIKNGDKMEHLAHLHEPSVLPDPIKIIYDGKDVLAIDKPASMPTHQGGLYQLNSALEITKKEQKSASILLPLHRLDRVVSGVLLFAKNSSFASKFGELMKENKIQKIYIARVHGFFPRHDIECTKAMGRAEGGKWKCCISLEGEGKPATTLFQFLSYNEEFNQSLVVCKPKTGRQHQLRVHLSSLGFPIVLDKLYSPTDEIITTKAYHNPTEYKKDVVCPSCNNLSQGSHAEPMWDQIYLHAYHYHIENILSVHTEIPAWALNDGFSPPISTSSIHCNIQRSMQ